MTEKQEPKLDLTKPYSIEGDAEGHIFYIQDGNIFNASGKFIRKNIFVEQDTKIEVPVNPELEEAKKLEGEFECEICGKHFRKHSTLLLHKNKFHKVMPVKNLPLRSSKR